jgi:hypothetical protein
MVRRVSDPPSTTLSNRSALEILEDQAARGERLLTPLGARLLAARRRIEQSGITLLNDDELEQEKAERRGGVEHR